MDKFTEKYRHVRVACCGNCSNNIKRKCCILKTKIEEHGVCQRHKAGWSIMEKSDPFFIKINWIKLMRSNNDK